MLADWLFLAGYFVNSIKGIMIMSITTKKTSMILVAGAALTAGLVLSPIVSADTSNPFAAAELSSGYMQLAEGKCGGDKKAEGKCGAEKKAEGKCGEAKCGADKKAEGKCGEAKCGADKKAGKEGKCGENMKHDAEKMGEGKCGADKKTEKEGKCGEAKCGANK